MEQDLPSTTTETIAIPPPVDQPHKPLFRYDIKNLQLIGPIPKPWTELYKGNEETIIFDH
jgi:hypothetical protein